MKKRSVIIIVALLLAAAGYYFFSSGSPGEYTYRTEALTRGDIEKIVRATGTITPIQTVKVGSQVSGTIAKLLVDFNSTVRKDQIVAVIDSTFLSASVREAEANLQRTNAQLNESERTLNRTKELFAKDLVSQADLDAAITTYQTSVAQAKQTEAALERARVNLRYAVIRAPIDGVVISRDVDVGQTVAASLQAPQLFVIANDLKKMQVEASVDEADIGQIAAGQTATFAVDAYPEENFTGTVTQVRLSPLTVQNVVTYTVIIEVPNPDLKLRPGMTATASILIDRRDDVLRIPAIALRFSPPDDVLKKIKEQKDDRVGGEGSGGGGARAETGGDSTSGDRGRRGGMNRDSLRARRNAQGENGGSMGGGNRQWNRGGGRPGGGTGGSSMGKIWVLGEGDQLRQVPVRTGLSDSRYLEVVRGELKEGDRAVLGVSTGDNANPRGVSSPFQQQGGGRRGM
jgi:HlyD family secretion protein